LGKPTAMNEGFQILFLALFLLPAIYFLITLQNTLKAISPENRKMPPANVWLMCIPVFNFYWQFIVVEKMAKSIVAECNKLQIPLKENKPGYNLGLAWNICYLLFLIPVIKTFIAFFLIIFWILYWVKINQYQKMIIGNQNSFQLDVEKNIFYGDKPVN
jgi:uncharacterized membrane protein YphA (DoxX/SURF4 family)